MRRSTRKRLIPLLVALVLTVVGAALAVPAINVSVQKVGGGAASNVEVDTTKAAVNWYFDPAAPWKIAGANITLDKGPGVDGTYKLYIVVNGTTTLSFTGAVSASQTKINVSFTKEIDLTDTYISSVTLVIAGKQVTVS